MRPVHRTRRRPFKVHAFAVISASVARALELVFARLPVRRASQMCAARINDEETIGCAIHPDAELLLPFGIHAKRILRRISDLENRVRFKKRARQEEAEERKEPCRQEGGHSHPNQPPAPLVDLGIRGARRGQPRRSGCLRGSHRRRAYILRGIHRGLGRGFRRLRIRIDLLGLRLRHVSPPATL